MRSRPAIFHPTAFLKGDSIRAHVWEPAEREVRLIVGDCRTPRASMPPWATAQLSRPPGLIHASRSWAFTMLFAGYLRSRVSA